MNAPLPRLSTKTMIFRALVLATLVALTSSQETCSVCGDGQQVGNPEGIFSFPGQPVVECGLLEEAGASGLIPIAQCGFLPGLITSDCSCEPAPVPDTPAP